MEYARTLIVEMSAKKGWKKSNNSIAKVITCYNFSYISKKIYILETTIVKIGNSHGLIIPKKILSTLGDCKTVDIKVKDGGFFITPLTENKARANWEKQFYEAVAKGFTPEDDSIHMENDFDKEEWTW